MSLDNMRGSYGRCPPFLVAGLLVACIILTFNWWSLSSQNYDLLKQIEELGEQLKVGSEEQDLCDRQRLSAEGRVKVLEEEIAQVRVNLEQQRTDNDELKKNLATKDDILREVKKEKDNTQQLASSCNTELESLKKLEISKDGIIASLRLEKDQFSAKLDGQKQELQQLQKELEQVRASVKQVSKKKQVELAVPKVSTAASLLKSGDSGMAVGGDHERDGAQELEKAENEENNAGEREVNPEEGAGDNGPEGPGGEEPAVQMEGNQIK